MPVSIEKMEREGESVKSRDVQGKILEIVKLNDGDWISSKQIEEVTGFRRQSINQAIRSLVDKNEVDQKQEGDYNMNYIRWK